MLRDQKPADKVQPHRTAPLPPSQEKSSNRSEQSQTELVMDDKPGETLQSKQAEPPAPCGAEGQAVNVFVYKSISQINWCYFVWLPLTSLRSNLELLISKPGD